MKSEGILAKSSEIHASVQMTTTTTTMTFRKSVYIYMYRVN